MCGASSFIHNFLVEVFTEVKVNLDLFKGKIAGKRSSPRTLFESSKGFDLQIISGVQCHRSE